MRVSVESVAAVLKHQLFLWLSLSLILPGCVSNEPISAPVASREKRHMPADGYHEVRRGDTLYSIAWLYGKDVRQLARWNSLQPPYTIYHEQRLRLKAPKAQAKAKVAKTPRAAPKYTRRNAKASHPKTASKPTPKPSQAVTQTAAVKAKPPTEKMPQTVRWRWPAKGKLLSRRDPKLQGKKGISIVGKSGDPVYAAAAGKVVYAGSGLSGYGRLIIVKHNREYLSAYAHNRQLVAKEGDWVKPHQLIARMGNSGANRTQLYFEIRKQGVPVDPIRYLPKR